MNKFTTWASGSYRHTGTLQWLAKHPRRPMSGFLFWSLIVHIVCFASHWSVPVYRHEYWQGILYPRPCLWIQEALPVLMLITPRCLRWLTSLACLYEGRKKTCRPTQWYNCGASMDLNSFWVRISGAKTISTNVTVLNIFWSQLCQSTLKQSFIAMKSSFRTCIDNGFAPFILHIWSKSFRPTTPLGPPSFHRSWFQANFAVHLRIKIELIDECRPSLAAE